MEALARAAWQSWGAYAKWTVCTACKEWRYSHSKGGERYVCVDCFDQGHK
jgi:hypothetical protein